MSSAVGCILAIDTAAPVVGVAVVHRGAPELAAHICFHWSERVQRKADALLLPAVGEALAAADASGDPLLGVAVTVGPGTFTGLRVGLATALGVAVARGVPVFPEGSLEGRSLLVSDRPLLVLLDARKNRFYGRWFTADGPVGQAEDAPLEHFFSGVGTVVGEGGRVAAERLQQAGLAIAPDPDRSCAVVLATAALDGRLTPVDAAEVGLRYVRPPDARRPTHVLEPRRTGH